jgi:hypothetical protein
MKLIVKFTSLSFLFTGISCSSITIKSYKVAKSNIAFYLENTVRLKNREWYGMIV